MCLLVRVILQDVLQLLVIQLGIAGGYCHEEPAEPGERELVQIL